MFSSPNAAGRSPPLRARDGDLAAFDTLYARSERRLFSFLLRLVNDRAEAEELFHDTFLTLLEGPRASFDTATFTAWLCRIARNLALNRIRTKSRGAPAATCAVLDDLRRRRHRAGHRGGARRAGRRALVAAEVE